MKKVILIAFLLAIIGGFAAWKYVFRSSSDSVISEEVEVEIFADDLFRAFETNENEANTAYLNKVMLVVGTVKEISEIDAGYSVYIGKEDADSGVLCRFSKDSFDEGSVKIGDQITIKGICNGFLFDVVLNKCALNK